jgi:hypothetical protein
VFQLVAGNPVITGTVISSTWANNTLSDIANNGLTNALTKDGQQTPTANIPMGGFRFTGLGNGVNRGDSVSLGQVQDNGAENLGSISGTGDAIIAASAPAITAYVTGQKFIYTPSSTNSVTNPTINISAVGAKTITQSNGVGLWSGALVVGTPYELLYDGTNFRIQSGALANQIVSMGSPYGMRNRLIDGNFNFWTNGTTSFNFTGAGTNAGFTADMWSCGSGTGGSAACTVSRQAPFSPGTEPAGSSTPTGFILQHQQTASASVQNPFISQRIESVTTLEGRSATLSLWLYVTSGTLNITSINVTQVFGTGGSPSGNVSTSATVNWTLTTTPQYFSVRLDIPSIAGKTLGSNNNDILVVQISLPLNLTYTVRTFQWQLEDCPANAPAAGLPTPFEIRPQNIDKMAASRFYLVTTVAARQTVTGATAIFDVPITFTPMRAAPASTLIAAGSRANVGSATLQTTSTGARFEITPTAGGDTFAIFDLWALDARV